MTADRRPVGVPPALLEAQRTAVDEVRVVQSGDHDARTLADFICRRCGHVVGDLRELRAGATGQPCQFGPVLTGTLQKDPDEMREFVDPGVLAPTPRRRIAGSIGYTALLDRSGLPLDLPFWCDRHGKLTYPASHARSLAYRQLADPDAAPARVRVDHRARRMG